MVAASEHFTVGHLARTYNVPSWKVRAVVDGLGVPVPRAGLYRLIPAPLVPAVEAELRRQGVLQKSETAAR